MFEICWEFFIFQQDDVSDSAHSLRLPVFQPSEIEDTDVHFMSLWPNTHINPVNYKIYVKNDVKKLITWTDRSYGLQCWLGLCYVSSMTLLISSAHVSVSSNDYYGYYTNLFINILHACLIAAWSSVQLLISRYSRKRLACCVTLNVNCDTFTSESHCFSSNKHFVSFHVYLFIYIMKVVSKCVFMSLLICSCLFCIKTIGDFFWFLYFVLFPHKLDSIRNVNVI